MLPLPLVGSRFEDEGVVPLSTGNARPSMARQSLAVLAVTRASSAWASTLPIWLRVWARHVCC